MKTTEKETLAQEVIDFIAAKNVEQNQFSRILICAYKKVLKNKNKTE